MDIRRLLLLSLILSTTITISGCIYDTDILLPTTCAPTTTPPATVAPTTLAPTTIPPPTSGELKVHFIDVDQGDAILLQLNEMNILVDGGNRDGMAVTYLASQGVTTLDLIISTHPHADHIGGLIEVLETCTVGEVIDAGVVHTSQAFEDYLTLIDEKNITYTVGRAGDVRNFSSGLLIEILAPVSPSSSDLNNASVVIKFTFGDVSFLLMGDAEVESEAEILASGVDVGCTILKIGHHGSNTASSEAFLAAASPMMAVIMCGEGNSYGHPHEVTLQKLASLGVATYRTDIDGTIVVTAESDGYTVTTENN